jgi:hypothetical protein
MFNVEYNYEQQMIFICLKLNKKMKHVYLHIKK